MANIGLGILGTLGTVATVYPKETLAITGLRTRSEKDVITGKRIPGSSSNRFFQLIGTENKEDAENTIKEAEKASSRKKGLVFVFKLLLKTLKEIRRIPRRPSTAAAAAVEIKKLKILKEKYYRLLYIIVYSSVLTDDDAPQDMRNLLVAIKTTFRLSFPRSDSEVTNWKKLYGERWQSVYDRDGLLFDERGAGSVFNNLDNKIRAMEDYIKIVTDKSRTRERRMARMVARHAASKHNHDPTLLPYEKAVGDSVGPFTEIGTFLPDTPEHKQKTIDERERVRSEKFKREYQRRRKEAAIRRDIALGRTTPEEAANFPEEYGRALNTPNGGRRSRKRKTRKTRKTRKRRRKRTRKRRKSKRKTKRKYK